MSNNLNLSNLSRLSRRDLYAASKRAKREGFSDLAVYVEHLANLKYAIEKNDNQTNSFVADNANVMTQYKQQAQRQASAEIIQRITTSSKNK